MDEAKDGITSAEAIALAAKKFPKLSTLAKWLDTYHLDGLIGMFLPGAGDAITGAGSLTILVAALRNRVPRIVLVRMLGNIGLDVLLGMVPILGDIFDFLFGANKKNLALLARYEGEHDGKAGLGDYLVIGTAIALVALSIAVPILLATWLFSSLWEFLTGLW